MHNNYIKGVKVEDYIEGLDGSIEGVKLVKDLGDGYGLYVKNDGKGFVVYNYNMEDEYIWRAV